MTALYPVDAGSRDAAGSTSTRPPTSGEPSDHHLSRRSVRTLLAVLVVLVTAIPVAVWAIFVRPDNATVGSPAPSITAPSTVVPSSPQPSLSASQPPLGAGAWRTLPTAPLPAGLYAGTWTGTELFVHRPNLDAQVGSINAAYNPSTNSWRRVPSSGLPAWAMEGGYRCLWTGTEVLTFGMMDAAYNPRTNTWRPIAQGPGGPSATVWTGQQVLSWGGGCCGSSTADGSAYDPIRDVWTPMPAAPLAARHAAGVWTGRELIIVGGQDFATVFADAAAYNPTSHTWRRLPSLPRPVADASITWTGTEVYVIGGMRSSSGETRSLTTAMAYSPSSNTWRQLADMPLPRSRHLAVWTGQQLIVWGGEQWPMAGDRPSVPPYGLAYDPGTNRWAKLPVSPLKGRTGTISVWTGTDMLIWGGIGVSPVVSYLDAAAFRPQ